MTMVERKQALAERTQAWKVYERVAALRYLAEK